MYISNSCPLTLPHLIRTFWNYHNTTREKLPILSECPSSNLPPATFLDFDNEALPRAIQRQAPDNDNTGFCAHRLPSARPLRGRPDGLMRIASACGKVLSWQENAFGLFRRTSPHRSGSRNKAARAVPARAFSRCTRGLLQLRTSLYGRPSQGRE